MIPLIPKLPFFTRSQTPVWERTCWRNSVSASPADRVECEAVTLWCPKVLGQTEFAGYPRSQSPDWERVRIRSLETSEATIKVSTLEIGTE